MGHHFGGKPSFKLSAVSLLSSLALAPPLQAQTTEFTDSLTPTAAWVRQDSTSATGAITISVIADYKYGVASVDFYLDGVLHSKVVQETINPETGEYEFVLILQPSALLSKKCKVNAVVNPFGVGCSNLMPDLMLRI